MEYCTVYVTCRDRAEAFRIGRAVVETRLAACANILDGMHSLYWWEGQVTEDQETVLLLKTRAEQFEAVRAEVCALHSYEVPCVVAWPIAAGHPPYLDWITQETTDHE
ncbi:MAG: divalent-cation tolerance protein CutA [Bacteroidetes bacterium]|nr:MAG: divalent-cation tolerance protein CutA [Bacteroidota bacterium]